MDFDPRDFDDPRDHARRDGRGERDEIDAPRGRRGSSDDRDRDEEAAHVEARSRDRDDDDARTLGRGPGNERQGRTGTSRTAIAIRVGPTATVADESAIARATTPSRATWTCRAAYNASSFATAIASTPYVAPNRARSRLSARFEWSPVVTFATMMGASPIYVQATFDTCANRGSWRRRVCPDTGTMS